MSISLSTARIGSDRFVHIHAGAVRDLDALITLNDYLREIHSSSSRHHFDRGETIFSEGDPVEFIYKVISGTVRLCRYSPDGRRHIIDFVLAGDLIGFLENADQACTAEAVTEVMLVTYPRTSVDRLSASDPAMRTRVLCRLSAELLEAQRLLFVLGCQSARERVASFLVRLAGRTDVMSGDTLELPMGRQDIADHLGLTIETVCRVLSYLRSDGVVSVPTLHELVLNNMLTLRTLAAEN